MNTVTESNELQEVKFLKLQMTRQAERANSMVGEIKDLYQKLRTEECLEVEITEKYNKSVTALVIDEAERRGVSFCSLCEEERPASSMVCVLFTGSKIIRMGDHGTETEYLRDFSTPHLLCPTCLDTHTKKSGWIGPFNSIAQGSETFYLWHTDKRSDGLYAHVLGYNKLVPVKPPQAIPPDKINEKASQWGLPTTIGFPHRRLNEPTERGWD
ncbi:MAG: hypothetical protein WC763_01455 [Candidatus Paceibacterota bacterium]|jgi:hypothetical protein